MQGEEPGVGDHVVISLGQVIRRISAEEARAAWELYEQMLSGPGRD